MTSTTKWVYFFGSGPDGNLTEGSKDMVNLLGGKGGNLAEMCRMFTSVPQGFTVTTDACELYTRQQQERQQQEQAAEKNKQEKQEAAEKNLTDGSSCSYVSRIDDSVLQQIDENLIKLEKAVGATFGLGHIDESLEQKQHMLLLSVRSGGKVSMPGMMDTILNVGLNDETVQIFAQLTQNDKLAYDCYRRLLQMFGDVVMRVPSDKFEQVLTRYREMRQVAFDSKLSADDLKQICVEFKQIIKTSTGQDFPQCPKSQLLMAVEAVFKSFNNKRAIEYRRINKIVGANGTAVNIQRMVFGNMNDQSGTGVAFSRNPAAGDKKMYGEFLVNAQGEDVVAGIRTPQDIRELEKFFPECYQQLVECSDRLEHVYRDMQDMEFTIQNGEFFMLQCRSAKRTVHAAVRCAVEMIHEGLIDEKTALLRIQPASLDQLLHKGFDESDKKNHTLLGRGIAASPGAGVGRIAFDAEHVMEFHNQNIPCILVRNETSTEDVIAMNMSSGILTKHGGKTSHAAVVARGMGRVCVSGVAEINIDEVNKTLSVRGLTLTGDDYISIDGNLGEVFEGKVKMIESETNPYLQEILDIEQKYRTMGVRVNGETVQDALTAEKFGAAGIGLARTEHMFFEKDRVRIMRESILAKDEEARKKALASLKPYQRKDFEDMFKIIKGKPLTMRLLDPPLHEYLPQSESAIQEVAHDLNIPVAEVKEKIMHMKEANPLIGHRGCRVGIHYPEFTVVQVEAIMEAAVDVADRDQIPCHVEIMVPMVSYSTELIHQKAIVEEVVARILKTKKSDVPIKFQMGTMIETPRSALIADKLAAEAEFFSFGSNDLTALTFGYSRDDASHWVPMYLEKGILPADPFTTMDNDGVGELIKLAVQKGRSVNPSLEIGICGEVGGDPDTIQFLSEAGLDYVSVSPYRVPIARLAACHAALKKL